jgi:hypothetical protein
MDALVYKLIPWLKESSSSTKLSPELIGRLSGGRGVTTDTLKRFPKPWYQHLVPSLRADAPAPLTGSWADEGSNEATTPRATTGEERDLLPSLASVLFGLLEGDSE